MRVLYVGYLGENESSAYRRNAILRLGHDVIDFDMTPYQTRGGALISALRTRTLFGWTVEQLNKDLISLAAESRPELVWFDKPIYIKPKTLSRLRASGALMVQYCIDNPFGPRNDPGWRLIRQSLPEYDLHLVQRDIGISDYMAAGARDVQYLRTAYEPAVHFPPPPDWSDQQRKHDVVFIGNPYDNRMVFLETLATTYNIPLRIWGGPRWSNFGVPGIFQRYPLFDRDYRETIWRSKICLSFVTHSNCDDVAHKSFEIAACGGFLLAEDTPGHRDHFADNKEAVFFKTVEECAAKAKRYLEDEQERTRISTAGSQRALGSGYSNDARIAKVFSYIGEKYMLDRTR